MQSGDADAAIKEFQVAIHLHPDDSGFQGNLGTAYLQKTDFAAAISQFRVALKLDPEKASLHHDLALALKLSDDLPAAVAEWKEAIRFDPNLADAYYSLGVTLWQSGDFPGAAEQLRQAIQIRPDYAEAYYTLGTVLKQMNQLPGGGGGLARKRFASIPISPALTPRWRQFCGNRATAPAPPPKARLAPRSSTGQTNLQSARFATNSGRRLLTAGDLEGAISQFRTAIRVMPSYALAHYELGAALSQKGLKDEADGEYKKAAELDPHLVTPVTQK